MNIPRWIEGHYESEDEAENAALRAKVEEQQAEITRSHSAILSLTGRVEELQGELDRPKHETLRQLADAVERNAHLQGELSNLRAEHFALLHHPERQTGELMAKVEKLTQERDEARGMSAVDRSGCDRALQQMEDAVTVMQAQQQRAEQAEARLAAVVEAAQGLLDALGGDSYDRRALRAALAAAREQPTLPLGHEFEPLDQCQHGASAHGGCLQPESAHQPTQEQKMGSQDDD